MENYPLVEILASSQDASSYKTESSLPGLENVSFKLQGIRALRPDTAGWRDQACDYLAQRVARVPQDLHSHVQRIHIHLQKQESAALAGALLDLFIVLEDKGRPLRERMLKLSQPHLDQDHYQLLFDGLSTGLSSTSPMPGVFFSMLSKGLVGSNRLVEFCDEHEDDIEDVLAEARDYLEYSQINEARKVLEAAVLRDPHRAELHHELLDIYRSSHDVENFSTMFHRLNLEVGPLLKAWTQLADYLNNLEVKTR